MNKKLAIATLTGALFLTACGSETVYVTVEPSTTTTPKTTTTVSTRPPASFNPPAGYQEVPNDYDPEAYDTAIWADANEFWWEFTKEQLLNMGLVICQEFDAGSTLDQVTAELVDILTRNNLLAYSGAVGTMVGAALVYLCPEHSWWLETI